MLSVWIHPFQATSLWFWDGSKVVAETVSHPCRVRLPEHGAVLFTDASEPLSDAFQGRLIADLSATQSRGEAVQALAALLQQVSVGQETLFGTLFHPSVDPQVSSR